MQTSEVHEKDLGRGINARDAENQLEPGYWEQLKNAETDGHIVKKRKGYQQLGGYLPFRVQSVEVDANKFCFNLDSYVDLSRLRSSPLIVRGTVFKDGVSFTEFPSGVFTEAYYNEFDVTIRRTGTAFTVPQAAHGHNSWLQHASVYESTSESNLGNELIIPDTHQITATPDLTGTGLVQTDVTVNQSSTFLHASIDASSLGLEHYYPNTAGTPTFATKSSGVPLVMSFDVLTTPATPLQSSNLLVSVYRKVSATEVEKIIPDDITINGTAVDITITNVTDTSEYIYVATAVPDAQVVAGQVTAAAQTVTLSGVTPFTHFSVYTVSSGIREYVIPDTAIYDDATKELTVTFATNGAINYQIYYQAESLQVNQLCVDRPALPSGTGTVSTVELDIYGIDPLEVMTEENRNHWLTHIDTYRSQEETKLLTGVAGVEYELATPNLSTLYPRFEQVLESDQYIIPFFQNDGEDLSTGRLNWEYCKMCWVRCMSRALKHEAHA